MNFVGIFSFIVCIVLFVLVNMDIAPVSAADVLTIIKVE